MIYINGINTTFEEFLVQLNSISELLDGHFVYGVYNSTSGPLTDLADSIYEKFGGETPPVKLLSELVGDLYEQLKDMPDARIDVIGFSEGAIIAKNVLENLSENEKKLIYAVTHGGGSMIFGDNFLGVDNVVGSRDYVSRIVARSDIKKGLQNGNVRMVPSQGNCLCDHAFMSPTYENQRSDFGKFFLVRNKK